jgi:fluoroquinolone transport system permease protein
MIFSDPAAMGLFFMGAIVLLEKSQRVINSIAVSPVKITEYINAKIVSLGIISTAVGVILAVSAGEKHFIRVILGTFLGSVIFSLLGLIVATRITSLNQFMVATIPFELICIVPPVVYLLGYKKELMLIHPGCIVIQLITGEAGMNPTWFLLLFIWIVIIYDCAYRSVKSMFREVGGVKL